MTNTTGERNTICTKIIEYLEKEDLIRKKIGKNI